MRFCISHITVLVLIDPIDENIRIESEVIKRLGREEHSVRIPGDDAYIGTLNVYHELHCLVGSDFQLWSHNHALTQL